MTDTFLEIPVADCRPSPTARPVIPIKVVELAQSIQQVGLRQPISVRTTAHGYEIRGGGHRHAAFVQLGRETIPAFIREDDDLRAELAEIDENLIRNELSPAARAAAVARRKAIYEELHPETRPTSEGGEGRRKETRRHFGDESVADRFSKQTASATGKSERTVQREAERGEKLGADAGRVAGTSLDVGDELDALVKLPAEKRADLIDRAAKGEKVSARHELKKDRRNTREQDLGSKILALPAKKYGVILADPEWRFEPYSRETGMDRAADNHYPTSEVEKIAARPVADIAADDCVLFLWATVPMLPACLRVMEAWGFEYRSHVIWKKDRPGTGYWFINQHELLLVGTRGRVPAPAPGTQARSVIDAPVGKHSAKPETFYTLIEEYYPNLPKIELNARAGRKGWDAWGNEVDVPLEESAPNNGGADDSLANGRVDNLEAGGAGEGLTQPVDPASADSLEIPENMRRGTGNVDDYYPRVG